MDIVLDGLNVGRIFADMCIDMLKDVSAPEDKIQELSKYSEIVDKAIARRRDEIYD